MIARELQQQLLSIYGQNDCSHWPNIFLNMSRRGQRVDVRIAHTVAYLLRCPQSLVPEARHRRQLRRCDGRQRWRQRWRWRRRDRRRSRRWLRRHDIYYVSIIQYFCTQTCRMPKSRVGTLAHGVRMTPAAQGRCYGQKPPHTMVGWFFWPMVRNGRRMYTYGAT
jgi:hypothetical protein